MNQSAAPPDPFFEMIPDGEWNACIGSQGDELNSAVGDKDLRGIIADLEPYVMSLARIGDDGQELRYATNRDGKRSLEQYPLVNLLHIRNSLQTLKEMLTKIRSSHPLAALVGLEMSLKYLSDDKAIFALQQWALAYPPITRNPNDLGINFWDRDWEEMKKHNAITNNLVETITSNLSCEELAELEVNFYIGRDGVFGEYYGSMLSNKVAELKSADSRWKDVHHIMTKMNLLPSVIMGAEAFGRPTLAAKSRQIRAVDSNYGISHHTYSLDSVRA